MKRIKVIVMASEPEQARQGAGECFPGEPVEAEFFDVGSTSKTRLMKAWLFKLTDAAALYTLDFSYMKKKRLWLLFLCLGSARRCFIIEASAVREVSRINGIIVNGVLILLEGIADALIRVAFIVFLPAYKAYIKRRPRYGLASQNTRRMVFFRTDRERGLAFGGSISHIKGFTEAIQSLGYEVDFITSDKLENIKTRMHVVRPGNFFTVSSTVAHLYYNIKFIIQAVRHLRTITPDFLYHRHEELTFSPVFLARYLNLPLVLEFNSSEVWTKRYWGKKRFLWFYRQCEEISLLGADHIVTVSEVNKRNLMEWYKIQEDKITVNPNGVNRDLFVPDPQRRVKTRQRLNIEGKTVIGFSGTFGVWHGVEVLASVMADVVSKAPDVLFLWIGKGSYISYVREAVAEHGLENHVMIVGPVPHQEMPAYLDACDILASPHVPQADGGEFFGSPTKLFEYMAMEKGIVASDLGQIKDALEHERNALLVKPGNKVELIEALLRLVRNPSLREYLGKNARQRALESYTWEKNARRVLSTIIQDQGIKLK